MISERENHPPAKRISFLRQAELQLWVWRTENRLLPPKRRRSPRMRRVPDSDGDPSTIIGALPAL
jgi:hypothetical protein